MHILLLLAAVSTGTFADGPPPRPDHDKVQTDEDKAQGSWIVEKQQCASWLENFGSDVIRRFTEFDIKGDACTIVSRDPSTDKEERDTVTLALDPKQTPAQMDFVADGIKSKIKAIYRFDSDGSLIIAIGGKDSRPKGFDPKKETIFVFFLKKKM